MRLPFRLLHLATATLAINILGHAASLNIYLSAPATQSTFLSSALTENFDALSTGSRTTAYLSPIGTYELSTTNPFSISDANQYGGADGTPYMFIGSSNGSNPITLDLNGRYNYFGFWWSAGDVNNGISFYSGNTFLARISTGDITSLLSPRDGTVTAIDNQVYNSDSYYGNPNTGQNTNEPYSYVHIAAAGVKFDRIVFDNSGSTGFESDNHSVYSGNITLPGTSVFVRNVPSADAPVPEPSSASLMISGSVILLSRYVIGRLSRSRQQEQP